MPRQRVGSHGDVVARECAQWNERHVVNAQACDDRQEFGTKILEHLGTVIDRIHFVDSDDDLVNAN